MICSLHSVTTGSRDRANVPLIIIIIHTHCGLNSACDDERRVRQVGEGEALTWTYIKRGTACRDNSARWESTHYVHVGEARERCEKTRACFTVTADEGEGPKRMNYSTIRQQGGTEDINTLRHRSITTRHGKQSAQDRKCERPMTNIFKIQTRKASGGGGGGVQNYGRWAPPAPRFTSHATISARSHELGFPTSCPTCGERLFRGHTKFDLRSTRERDG